VADVFRKSPGHELRSGSTYGGHTVACAATLANIAIIEDNNLVERAPQMDKYLKTELEKLYKHSIVGDVRGSGMFWAIELLADRKTCNKLAPK
jgi:adenosylmethionine-8-amino-7-oxononanoate aminotransferase